MIDGIETSGTLDATQTERVSKMSQLNDVIWSAIAAALAWAIYEYTGKPSLSFLFLIVLCAIYVFCKHKADKRDRSAEDEQG